jgi:hypothetical protein
MATSLQSNIPDRDAVAASHLATLSGGRGHRIHYATCALLGMLAMTLSVTAVGVVIATDRSASGSSMQVAAELQRPAAQRPLRDAPAGDTARARRAAKTPAGAPESQAASAAVDAPIRDQQSYIEAVKRCALAQTKRERENCE